MSDDDYQKGVEIRRAVLGDDYVDQSLVEQGAFNEPVIRFATEAYWAKIWSRGVLPRRDSSIAVISMLIALNKMDELAVHLRAALRNGMSMAEIREVFLLAAVYCGAPASHGAFRVAAKALGPEIKAYNIAQKQA